MEILGRSRDFFWFSWGSRQLRPYLEVYESFQNTDGTLKKVLEYLSLPSGKSEKLINLCKKYSLNLEGVETKPKRKTNHLPLERTCKLNFFKKKLSNGHN